LRIGDRVGLQALTKKRGVIAGFSGMRGYIFGRKSSAHVRESTCPASRWPNDERYLRIDADGVGYTLRAFIHGNAEGADDDDNGPVQVVHADAVGANALVPGAGQFRWRRILRTQ
jgi:hypothetical protein